MRIFVCVKRVPDTGTLVRLGPDGRSLDTAGVRYVMSPYDEFALEAALRTRDEVSGEVVVVTLGYESSKETLRSALAMGADRAVLLHGEVSHDGLATAKALAAEVMGASPELVLLGVKAADDDQEQVGPMLATILGCACATAVSSFTVEGGGRDLRTGGRRGGSDRGPSGRLRAHDHQRRVRAEAAVAQGNHGCEGEADGGQRCRCGASQGQGREG